jgi:hypothetical protein
VCLDLRGHGQTRCMMGSFILAWPADIGMDCGDRYYTQSCFA